MVRYTPAENETEASSEAQVTADIETDWPVEDREADGGDWTGDRNTSTSRVNEV